MTPSKEFLLDKRICLNTWETDTEEYQRKAVYGLLKSSYYELSDDSIFSDL